uniref:Uncharacterized protein n=1 Tax=Lutzomyia longipalpis TaxID=7200 RepID=A0A7G3B851_LUTLO
MSSKRRRASSGSLFWSFSNSNTCFLIFSFFITLWYFLLFILFCRLAFSISYDSFRRSRASSFCCTKSSFLESFPSDLASFCGVSASASLPGLLASRASSSSIKSDLIR